MISIDAVCAAPRAQRDAAIVDCLPDGPAHARACDHDEVESE